MKLLVGLGNPGREYAFTRHNIGWRGVEEFAGALNAPWRQEKSFHSFVAETRLGSEKVLLACPTTFMNESGLAVQSLLAYFHLERTDLLVLQDEMDFPFGAAAFAKQGGAAGHNGIRSIQERLGTDQIQRIRIGISRPLPPLRKEAFVLQAFSPEEAPLVPPLLEKLTSMQKDWVIQGIDKAMNQWNGKER